MRGVAQAGQKACKDTHNGHGTGDTATGKTDADRAAGSDENGQNLGAGQLLPEEHTGENGNPEGCRILKDDIHGRAGELDGVLAAGEVHANAPGSEQYEPERVLQGNLQLAGDGAVHEKGEAAEERAHQGALKGRHTSFKAVFADEADERPQNGRYHNPHGSDQRLTGTWLKCLFHVFLFT